MLGEHPSFGLLKETAHTVQPLSGLGASFSLPGAILFGKQAWQVIYIQGLGLFFLSGMDSSVACWAPGRGDYIGPTEEGRDGAWPFRDGVELRSKRPVGALRAAFWMDRARPWQSPE